MPLVSEAHDAQRSQEVTFGFGVYSSMAEYRSPKPMIEVRILVDPPIFEIKAPTGNPSGAYCFLKF